MRSIFCQVFFVAAATLNTLNAEPCEQSITTSVLDGLPFVEMQIQKYPEILYLANADVRKTQEGQASGFLYSEKIFGQTFVEFDRTIMTLHCLNLILDGSDLAYEKFTKSQPTNNRLTKESFQNLNRQANKLLDSGWHNLSREEIAETMAVALVLGDMGKSEQARDLFANLGANAPDHDDFHQEMMVLLEKEPSLCQCFASLPVEARNLLVQSANLAHYGHITHLEGGPNMYSRLKQSALLENDPMVVAFDLFVHTCDVAGALGHLNQESSLVYTQSTHQAMQAMKLSVLTLSDPTATELDAYNNYLNRRVSWLGLDPSKSSDRVLARIGAMLRLNTKEDGQVLKNATETLVSKDLTRISKRLDAQNESLITRTPTYMPAVLVNLSNNKSLGNSREERIAKAVTLGLPFIAKILEKHEHMIGSDQADPNIPLNFNEIAGVAKTNPELLLSNTYTIDPEGNVHIKE